MEKKFKDKIVTVTGGSFDIGKATAIAFAKRAALCWINLAMMQGYDRNIAIKIVK